MWTPNTLVGNNIYTASKQLCFKVEISKKNEKLLILLKYNLLINTSSPFLKLDNSEMQFAFLYYH